MRLIDCRVDKRITPTKKNPLAHKQVGIRGMSIQWEPTGQSRITVLLGMVSWILSAMNNGHRPIVPLGSYVRLSEWVVLPIEGGNLYRNKISQIVVLLIHPKFRFVTLIGTALLWSLGIRDRRWVSPGLTREGGGRLELGTHPRGIPYVGGPFGPIDVLRFLSFFIGKSKILFSHTIPILYLISKCDMVQIYCQGHYGGR